MTMMKRKLLPVAFAVAAVSCAGLPGGQGTSSPSPTPITPPVTAEPTTTAPTMSRDQLNEFKGRVDAALDEINPAKDTLAAALGTHDFAAVHIGCRPVGQAGRDLNAALAFGNGYVLTDRIAALVKQMRQAADDLQLTERDCLALWPGSTESEWDQVAADMQKVADDMNTRRPQ
jgi:hypothetical protein